MKNIKCILSYDGTHFHGYQVQPGMRTVQGELNTSIHKLTGDMVNIIASGRTDAGVHARRQVCNFHTSSSIPSHKWKDALNSILPNDIVILDSTEVEEGFHARFNVKEKTYRYYIYNNSTLDIFRRNYSWFITHHLNIEKMFKASQLFIGQHDFTSFSSAKAEVDNRIRTIYNTSLWKQDKEIVFEITGNGFLYNMVRIIVGTLVEIGSSKILEEELPEIFKLKNRARAGKTAPPQGLVLWDVNY